MRTFDVEIYNNTTRTHLIETRSSTNVAIYNLTNINKLGTKVKIIIKANNGCLHMEDVRIMGQLKPIRADFIGRYKEITNANSVATHLPIDEYDAYPANSALNGYLTTYSKTSIGSTPPWWKLTYRFDDVFITHIIYTGNADLSSEQQASNLKLEILDKDGVVVKTVNKTVWALVHAFWNLNVVGRSIKISHTNSAKPLSISTIRVYGQTKQA